MAGIDRKSGERRLRRASLEGLESRALLSGLGTPPNLSPTEVGTILARAAAASSNDGAIVAIVDRTGRPLGVRVEGQVAPEITSNPARLTFAVDGALAKARTAAFFSSDSVAVSSRTMQFLAQSTITQREVDSNPNIPDPNSVLRGPGFVAPVGKKGHFPPRIKFMPEVGPFEIEHTNRDSLLNPGLDEVAGTADDLALRARFNVDPAFVPAGNELNAPESFGRISGLFPNGRSRGMGTLPGGLPIYINHTLVGGIGVFFPGKTGFATEENSDLNDAGLFDPLKTDLALEAEYIAFAAAGGSRGAGLPFGNAKGLPPLDPSFDLPFNRIDVNGVTLDIYGGHGLQGPSNLVAFGRTVGTGDPASGVDLPVDPSGATLLAGQSAPTGWLVTPHASTDGTMSAGFVSDLINRGISQAKLARSNMRLPLSSTTRMVFAVTDNTGEVLGLYRMPDAPTGSIGEAVAKARNTAYYADPNELQPEDRVSNIPLGTAMSTRTFRYLALPHFPSGIDTYPAGPFSVLNDGQVRDGGPPLPPSAYQSAVGFDSFHPHRNFRDPNNLANQNGVVFSPGGLPLYVSTSGSADRILAGGLGVGGDVPDVNDTVAALTARYNQPPASVGEADLILYRGVRLPYVKFARRPFADAAPSSPQTIQPVIPKGAVKGLKPRAVQRILFFNKKAEAAARKAAGQNP